MERVNSDLVRAFAKALTEARAEAGISQELLAERANISTRHVSYLENGARQPTLTIFQALCVGLGIPMSDLVRRVEDCLKS
ncbi:helix-turn-helix domain-containing protein [Fuscovulum ytuae]|uniref:Helix-turn-helix transcriptional regulator n=1 Tax=Fuscovulum ytuae TaxID=3042299 RepID=A0ABY8Q6U3_9RHOB|nr:helix-turn-helix transcriptional regulator [Fuscovulum sp. YMD61]WGV16005.1 helix-turn-helix transcriptional regulator [Fuscovulum sp. YMD61]